MSSPVRCASAHLNLHRASSSLRFVAHAHHLDSHADPHFTVHGLSGPARGGAAPQPLCIRAPGRHDEPEGPRAVSDMRRCSSASRASLTSGSAASSRSSQRRQSRCSSSSHSWVHGFCRVAAWTLTRTASPQRAGGVGLNRECASSSISARAHAQLLPSHGRAPRLAARLLVGRGARVAGHRPVSLISCP